MCFMCFIYTHSITYCAYRKVVIGYENVDLILAPEDQTKWENSVKIDEHFSLFKSVVFFLICASGQRVREVCHCAQ